MARPNWNYIRVDVHLPDHEKMDDLSDKAFRTLIRLWCWCGEHLTDGFVREAKWKTFATKAVRDELVAHRLAERVDGGMMMHDFTGSDGHQRSRAEVDEKRAQRSEAGKRSAAARAAARAAPQTVARASFSPNGRHDSLNGSLNKRATEAEAEADTTRA